MNTNTLNGDISTTRILAGFISFLLPGLGQFLLGRPLTGLLFFIFAACLWGVGIFMIGAAFAAAELHSSGGSFVAIFLGGMVMIIPNLVAAYNAAHGEARLTQFPNQVLWDEKHKDS